MATAPERSATNGIEELLTCCICTETLDEPKTLPCFHSFCKKCLARYIEVEREKAKKKDQHSFDCPMCRTKFELKEGDSVERIPPNYFINALLDILPVIQQQTQKLHCESCKVAEASVTHRCIECERYLCKNCLTAHNNWPDFKQHDVMTLAELAKPENQGKARGKPRCKKEGHGIKPLVFYCNTCEELACINCVVLNHSKANHDYQPVDTVAKQHKKALKTTSADLHRKSNEVKVTLRKIDHATKNLQAKTKRAKDMILEQEKEILQEFTKKVKHNTAVLLQEVERIHSGVEHKLVKQHNEIKAYYEKVNGSLDFAKNIIEKASSEEVLLLGTEIQVNAKCIETHCPKIAEPIHNGVIEYQAKSTQTIVGNINLNDPGIVVDPVESLCDKSTILEGNIEHVKPLVEWMEDKKFGWQLCYRASLDGWGAEDFHRNCDDVGPTVTLVKCGTNIFGGFTDQSWKKESPSENMRPFKCPIKEGRNDKAIRCHPYSGAVFGGSGDGRDLFISSNASTNKYSMSNLGDTYQAPPGFKPGVQQTNALLAGSYEFTPSEIEVFSS
ncbi:E3 ubiquitin-protein ligase TRIM33-like isoform X2 [Dendronephthya gigantea]|uniref:E3 ubiquitin-protein ligase TRIM33-like isoform X2 n=1 Tax=Dendronephthya gigantea TaxID=151771 RepID=UPI00106D3AEC|nr:E3 ubiquitin-protein ligase TRIM33-like isoform X2 [Dendronephthya gigantea]